MEGVSVIGYEDFSKLDMRVAEIEKVEEIGGADKLFKLTVSIGSEVRVICAGIKQFYSMEELRGKKIIILTNLEPRTLKGVESQGMLLAVTGEDGANVSLLTPHDSSAVGIKVEFRHE